MHELENNPLQAPEDAVAAPLSESKESPIQPKIAYVRPTVHQLGEFVDLTHGFGGDFTPPLSP